MHVSGTSQNKSEALVTVTIETDFNLVFLPVSINGNATYMIVDTGAGFSVLDEAIAKEFGMTIENVRVMERPGGEVRLGSISSLNINLGDYDLKMPIAAANLSEGGFNDYIGRSCAGILGYDFISQYGFVIDYEKKQLSLYDPTHFKSQGGERLELSIKEGMPVVQGTVAHKEKEVKGNWLVDTGSMMSLGLNESFYTEHFKGITNPLESVAVGFGGSTPGKMYKLDGFVLASDSFPFIIAGHAEDGINDEFFDGVLGGELLSRYKLSFNYTSNELYVKSNSLLKQPIRWDLSGMLLAHREAGIEVLHVYQGSPADKANIKKGDYILKVNAEDAEEMSLPEVWKGFHNGEGNRFDLLIKSGDKEYNVKIVLTDYFD
jgi:hypothetical protein